MIIVNAWQLYERGMEKGRTRRRMGGSVLARGGGKEAVVVVVWQWWGVYVISACAARPLPPSPGLLSVSFGKGTGCGGE